MADNEVYVLLSVYIVIKKGVKLLATTFFALPF